MPHMLIAEDDRVLRTRIKRTITKKQADIIIHEADNGDAAINLMKGQTMDLVITDIQMPKASGLILLAFLNAFAPKVPCIVMTAYGTSRLKAKMPSDLLRFYDKPVDVEEIAVTVVTTLNRKQDPDVCGGIQLPDFINIAAMDRATATIRVTQQEELASKLFMKDGELIDAVAGNERGEPAAIMAMSGTNPDYAIEFGIPDDIDRTIKTPLTQLLRTVSKCFDDK